jgi:Ca-activated chloride channel family protein
MTLRLLISLSLLLLAWQKVCAQLAPADDFFNSGAQLYISNNVPAALERVELGLKTYPDDVKLKKLEQLLKQQQQQNQQQQNQQNQSQQQKQDQQKNQQQQNQQSSQKNSQDQQKQDQQKQNQAEQQKASAQKKDGEKQDKQDAEGQPVKAGQMTPEEAKRLLDAQKDNEQVLQLKPQGKPEDQNRPVKDW